MADTAKDGAKARRRNGGKKEAKKAVEGAPKGEAVQKQPQTAETKPGPKPSTGSKKSAKPKKVLNPEDCARTVMVFECPRRLNKDAVRARWPSAEAVHFLIRNMCPTSAMSVLFKTPAEAQAAAKDGTVEIAGATLRVAMHETPEQIAKRMDQRQRRVFLSSLPSDVTEADVLKAFPEAESVWLHKNKKGEANGWATVTLRTVEAAAAAAGVEVEVKGVKVTPIANGQKPPATESSNKRKAAEPSPSAAQPSTGTAEPGEASKPAKKKLKKAAAH